MSCRRSTAADREHRTVVNDVVRDNDGYERGRRSVIVDQAVVDWESWNDPTVASRGTVRWKLPIDGERGPSVGLVTGVAEIAPGGVLPRHHPGPTASYRQNRPPRRAHRTRGVCSSRSGMMTPVRGVDGPKGSKAGAG